MNLEIKRIGVWPLPIRLAIIVLSCVIVAFIGWQFLLADSIEKITKFALFEGNMKQQLVTKAYLKPYVVELQKVFQKNNETLQTLTLGFPTKNDIPKLIDTIITLSKEHGLNLHDINLHPSKKQKFTIKQPFTIRLNADYFQLGNFISAVESLEMIVHFDVVKINSNPLNTDLTVAIEATIYHYSNDIK